MAQTRVFGDELNRIVKFKKKIERKKDVERKKERDIIIIIMIVVVVGFLDSLLLRWATLSLVRMP